MREPVWVTDRGKIDEGLFCQEFLMTRELAYVGGSFFSKEGRVTDVFDIKREIFQEIKDHVTTGVARKVDTIFGTLKLVCQKEDIPVDDEVIHVANGTYRLVGGFTEKKEFCRYRLPVSYRPHCPEPTTWISFLHDLLEEEDIWTLQQFMGYCLIPSNAAQKMLLIVGRGGEGKSRIGLVMKAMLGNNMNNGSIAKVEHSPFARADLEHLLLMVDDDLKMEALKQTNYLKSIITAEQPMDLERKGEQSYQGQMHARIMAFGNGNLQSLHDRSHGFFRRQIILTTKPRDPDRVDDPYLGQKLIQEIEGIFCWALAGLYCLRGQDFRFSLSQKAQENLRRAVEDGNNILPFMKSEGYIRYEKEAAASSRGLYSAYLDWCQENMLKPLSQQTFFSFLQQNAGEYGLHYTVSVPSLSGRRVRGFQGVRLCRP